MSRSDTDHPPDVPRSADWLALEGSASPLGATWLPDQRAFNFALYSKHALSVTLLLYTRQDTVRPAFTYKFDHLINKSARVWHCRIREECIPDVRYYAYRISGPDEPHSGHRFSSKKLLLDPYARSVFFPPGFSRGMAAGTEDNAGRAPLAVLVRAAEHVQLHAPQHTRHTHDLIIYELHVRHFTRRPNSGVPESLRGTFAGVAAKIPYLKELGVTAVEFMPVTQQDPQEGSHWGYMPLAFFAPNHEYASSLASEGVLGEFRDMVDALHAADIEVILDVVYNHTCEGGEGGPTYSLRGLDNSTYYLMDAERERYRNDSGTGNTLNCANRYVRKMIVDSLLYWTAQMGVDGFRFDLASLFTRNEDGSINTDDPPVIDAISSLMDVGGIRLIAEAWDPVTYQLGRSFPGASWLQWNGRYRDEVRAFVKGAPASLGMLLTRLYGSCDLFPDDLMSSYHAYQSVNFIDSHDGFCLYDLVSYSRKHNEANGQGNIDGTDDNLSFNCGWEGDKDVPLEIVDRRERLARFFACLLFLSNGTPMFRAGDEFLNTQRGNNNPYNQDNETTWLDWDLLAKKAHIFKFFQHMIQFRKAHPSISRSRFWRDDIRWYGVAGPADFSASSRTAAYCLHGRSADDDDLYVMINGETGSRVFTIQEGTAADWRLAVDSSHAALISSDPDRTLAQLDSLSCELHPESIQVLVGRLSYIQPARGV